MPIILPVSPRSGMTFLQLCQRLRSECGASGSGPSTVVGQVGESQRLVNWINEAWLDIQEEHPDWQWLRDSFSFTTNNGQATYTPSECGIVDFGAWRSDTIRCYPTAVGTRGEMFLGEVDYDRWRNLYQFGPNRSVTNRPNVVTVCPDTSLGFGHTPDAEGYTIVGDYYKEPLPMVNDSDVPIMPVKHHMAIVYRAMMFYGSYSASPEIYSRGETEFKRIMRRMERDRLPSMTVAGTLA